MNWYSEPDLLVPSAEEGGASKSEGSVGFSLSRSAGSLCAAVSASDWLSSGVNACDKREGTAGAVLNARAVGLGGGGEGGSNIFSSGRGEKKSLIPSLARPGVVGRSAVGKSSLIKNVPPATGLEGESADSSLSVLGVCRNPGKGAVSEMDWVPKNASSSSSTHSSSRSSVCHAGRALSGASVAIELSLSLSCLSSTCLGQLAARHVTAHEWVQVEHNLLLFGPTPSVLISGGILTNGEEIALVPNMFVRW